MKRLTLLSGLLALAILASASGQEAMPRDQLPPCSGSVPSRLKLELPFPVLHGRLPVGRIAQPKVIHARAPGWDVVQDSLTIGFAPAAHGKLRFGYPATAAHFNFRNTARGKRIRFARDDPKGRVIASWAQTDGVTTCQVSSDQVLSDPYGLPRTVEHVEYQDELHIKFKCAQYPAAGGVEIRISSRGQTRHQIASDQCAETRWHRRGPHWHPYLAYTRNWDLKADTYFREVDFRITDHLPKPQRFRFQVLLDGRVFESGSFRGRTKVLRRPKRIHEGSDAFVNYCINGGATIYSHDHKLYCIRPGSKKDSISQLHHHRRR